MSQRCMPILILNMGAEMIYILEQRLKTLQNVSVEKSNRVLGDIMEALLNRKFLDEIFKPQDLHSRKTMRYFFEKLAHTSIMRLNETSMDKLFDLITMTVKYQVQLLVMPEQLLTITINHLEGMRSLIPPTPQLEDLIDGAHAMVMSAYRGCQIWELYLLRCCMLTFFQMLENRVRVSVLMRENKQMESGHFYLNMDENIEILMETHLPGVIRYYENGAMCKTTKYPMNDSFTVISEKDDLNLGGKKRTTQLGTNIYHGVVHSLDIKGPGTLASKQVFATDTTTDSGDMPLLFAILGQKENAEAPAVDVFDMSMFNDVTEEQKFIEESEALVKRINASQNHRSLKEIMDESDNKDDNKTEEKQKPKKKKGQALAEMMDDISTRPETAKKGGRTASQGRAQPARDKTPNGRPTSSTRPNSRSTSTNNRAASPANKATTTTAARPGTRDRSASVKRRPPSSKKE